MRIAHKYASLSLDTNPRSQLALPNLIYLFKPRLHRRSSDLAGHLYYQIGTPTGYFNMS